MTFTKGYYSIIQYCPDPSRLEAVNVGIALFCPETRWLGAKFERRKSQITKAFGPRDAKLVALQLSELESRLHKQSQSFERLHQFEAFVATRANAFTLTTPRFVKMADPEKELDDLLARLVGRPKQATPTRTAKPSIGRELGSRLQQAGLISKIRPDVKVHPPALPKPIYAPFAYQNGRLNLIEPVEFVGKTSAVIFRDVSERAVTGSFLRNYRDPEHGDVALVVVAKFGPTQQKDCETAKEVFEQHRVPMYTWDALDPLIQEIHREAHK